MEADADEADSEWKSNLSNGVFTFLAPEVLAKHKADGSEWETAGAP
jgi:hypothetical protein